ncbi:ATP-binding protein [Sulfurisoma sediminicola]|uniref:histidine kinase n=1 Tax=Sulfurisoma sediminicola TaxID=1381557 RepID=A0A497XN67_9PROT|nr:ATP-binding protein [Sulfurisoma sediminicola]RLJ67669.1 two-component system OmpR family sensor kinase [Sulfurisoma sediminicola]
MSSIRRQLIVALLAAVALTLLLATIGTYRVARQEVDALFDYHLRQLALSLRDQAFSSAHNPLDSSDLDNDFDFVIQVWTRDGTRLYFSHPHASLPDRAQLGFATIATAEGRWRIFAVALRDQIVQVSQPLAARERLAAAAAARTLLPSLVLLPLLAAILWWLVGRSLAPLDRIALSVRRRSPAALDPLSTARVPEETRPLVDALNDLLVRLKSALEAQRAFVADAAHELRTPLTALQLQAQLAERAATPAEREAALTELRHGLQRATHVVQQLLTLARQDPDAAPDRPPGPVRLAELAAQVAADHATLAEHRGIDLGVGEADAMIAVSGDFSALRTLVANLVDNAVRYTPSGGRVDLAVGSDGGAPWLEVADSGPGIPAEDRERVFDRFFRRQDTSEPGSGLGLAIVQTIAARHGARIVLGEAALGGLAARVVFPAAPAAPSA